MRRWEEQTFNKLAVTPGAMSGIATMVTRVTRRDERIRHLAGVIQANRFSKEEVLEAMSRLFFSKKEILKGKPSTAVNKQRGKDKKAAARLTDELAALENHTEGNNNNNSSSTATGNSSDLIGLFELQPLTPGVGCPLPIHPARVPNNRSSLRISPLIRS